MLQRLTPLVPVLVLLLCSSLHAADGFAALSLPVAKPAIPKRVEMIVGLGKETRYRPRIEAVHALGKELVAAEMTALIWFLHRKEGEDALPLKYVNPIKNDITHALIHQYRPPQELTAHLVPMFRDPKQDAVWRDYCVQFIGQWYPKVGGPVKRAEMRKALDEALARKTIPTAGTALIALSGLVGENDIDASAVSRSALAIALDSDAANAARVSAFQVCGRLKCQACLPGARKLADSKGSATLRMSCLAVVGTLGDRSDIPLLERGAESRDVRLRTTAKSAIKRIQKREG